MLLDRILSIEYLKYIENLSSLYIGSYVGQFKMSLKIYKFVSYGQGRQLPTHSYILDYILYLS
jgi:hypothetical protein